MSQTVNISEEIKINDKLYWVDAEVEVHGDDFIDEHQTEYWGSSVTVRQSGFEITGSEVYSIKVQSETAEGEYETDCEDESVIEMAKKLVQEIAIKEVENK